MNKRGLFRILIIFILIFLPFTLAFSGSGEGNLGSPYNITNCTQLQEVNNNLTAYYQLTGNIDCSDTTNWNTGAGFIPLGNEISSFSGNFQGNNYNVTGLYINNSTRDYSGLFGYVLGEVKNIRLINANITSKEFVGGIAGLYDGTANLSNVHISGKVSGTTYVGGLTGYLEEDLAILDSSSEAIISSTSTYIGGLVGSSYTGTIIENSYFTGSIQSTGNYAGGIAGIFSGLRITNCYSTGNITTSKSYVGGITGKFVGGIGATISNSNNSGNITASGSYVGGIVGLFGEGDVTNSHSTGHINGAGYVGGLFGSFGEGDIINSYATGNVDGNNDCVGGLAGEFVIGQILGSNASGDVNSSTGWYVGGLVGEFYEEWGEGYAYLISNSHATGNVQGYSQVGGLVGDFYTGNITDCSATGNVLGEDVEIGGLVGYFNGVSISNSYAMGNVNGQNDCTGGLVGKFDSGLFLVDSYSTGNVTGGDESTGGLVGKFEGNLLEGTDEEIRSSYATGNVVSSGDYTGGLIGYFSGDTITSRLLTSYSTGNVNSTGNYVGGLVGYFYGALNESYATGNVKGDGIQGGIGGLVGSFAGRILSDSYATGNVEGVINTGGLVGISSSGGESTTIKNSYSTGNINSRDYVGGLVGFSSEGTISESYSNNTEIIGEDYVGGLVGWSSSTIINNTYSRSNIYSTGQFAGGLVGLLGSEFIGSVYNSYSTGNVEGLYTVGGLIGGINNDDVHDSFSTGNVSLLESGAWIGGVFGDFQNVWIIDNVYWYNSSHNSNLNCYYDGGVCENSSAISDLDYFYDYENSPMNLSSETGWNFDSVWDDVYNSTDYPVLQWQEITPSDTIAPTYAYATENLNTTLAGQAVLFSALWNDTVSLHPNGQYIFSTNNTGTWVNDTAVNFTSTPEWANVTKTLNSTEGIKIGYLWYVKDNSGNWNATGMNTLTTTQLEEEEDEEELGSGISYPKKYPLDEQELSEENDLELGRGDKIIIPKEEINYILRLDKFNSSEATLRVDNITNGTNNPILVRLPLEIPQELDLDSDSVYDVVIIYSGINSTSNKARISVTSKPVLSKAEFIPEKEIPQGSPKFKVNLKLLIILGILFIISLIVFLILSKDSKRRKRVFKKR